ncbi:hypothetical protein B0H15DRAFT_838338 [Mycena belliarum]|uniref:Uncharacterized protein n=1 Tax=Mycena belliarum TaxID=1033014 RepID=A0AAD6U4K1_9AGAR|nr:hypothetical protein B0H15DRAFT_838338 [Mycena belliae]
MLQLNHRWICNTDTSVFSNVRATGPHSSRENTPRRSALHISGFGLSPGSNIAFKFLSDSRRGRWLDSATASDRYRPTHIVSLPTRSLIVPHAGVGFSGFWFEVQVRSSTCSKQRGLGVLTPRIVHIYIGWGDEFKRRFGFFDLNPGPTAAASSRRRRHLHLRLRPRGSAVAANVGDPLVIPGLCGARGGVGRNTSRRGQRK